MVVDHDLYTSLFLLAMVPIIVHRIEQHPTSVGVIEPSYIPEMLPGNSLCDNSNLLLPSVMIWHTLIQFPLSYHTLSICPNANCTGVLSFYVWPIGQNKGKQPRLIHDTKSIVLRERLNNGGVFFQLSCVSWLVPTMVFFFFLEL